MLCALYVKPANQFLLPVFHVRLHLERIHAHNAHFMMTIYQKKRITAMIVEFAVLAGEKIISTAPPVVLATLQIYGIIMSV
jgi:hypothetical protein